MVGAKMFLTPRVSRSAKILYISGIARNIVCVYVYMYSV